MSCKVEEVFFADDSVLEFGISRGAAKIVLIRSKFFRASRDDVPSNKLGSSLARRALVLLTSSIAAAILARLLPLSPDAMEKDM